jgi:hypothetical protein
VERRPRRNEHPIPTPAGVNTGPLATAAWLVARGLFPKERNWFVEVVLTAPGARFEIEIYDTEWGFAFRHDDRVSWIRVTDIPFIHGRDEFALLDETHGLRSIGDVLRVVEQRYDLAFLREHATIRTNVENGEPAIREWLAKL